MSGIHRAMEKAERDGLLTWTRPDDRASSRAPVLEDAPRFARQPSTVDPVDDPVAWDIPGVAAEDAPSDGLLNPLFVVATDPGSLAAEQYRLLRTRLEGRENAGRTQLLVVTSPRLGEGKTTTSANLALTMAQEFQHKVLLVEADLRRPTLAALFGVESGPGLVDVLVGTATLEEALVAIPGQSLFLLPAGAGAARSTELLASSAMQRTVDSLRARFDRIVIDTPPMSLSDTHVLTRIADGVLMVVRSGVTPRPAVEHALGGLDRRKLVGIVLNEVDDKADAYAYPGAYARSAGE
jgi:capsular exopolysaccharide synthesis family protein